MKKAGKRLFRRLGELRDVHVMQEWVHRLDSSRTIPSPRHCCNPSLPARLNCNRKRCRRWQNSTASSGSAGAVRFPAGWHGSGPGSLVFRHLALERWTEAHKLHRQVVRSGSPAAFHRLRIGIKRFRYIVENFLPDQHAAWSDDLKHMQDLLGEVHDLDVLWPAAVQANVFPDDSLRSRWQNRIHRGARPENRNLPQTDDRQGWLR